jgi:O-methyltransferase involved in polyketide biosynthesis
VAGGSFGHQKSQPFSDHPFAVFASVDAMTIGGYTLEGVSATALWSLHSRATEAERSDAAICDPLAVKLLHTVDYDYLKFGKPNQLYALRAQVFDAAAAAYLATHPKASVVALGEGLQTSFWRLDAAGVARDLTWYSVDLPPVIALRRQLLPSDERIIDLAQSALDRSWMDRVDSSNGVFITAEGLLMYLDPDDVLGLIADCARRFTGGRMIFDSIPYWLSRRTMAGVKMTNRYVSPPMPFGFSADEGLALAQRISGVSAAHDIATPQGRGRYRLLFWPALDRIRWYHRHRPSVTLLEFG